LNYYELLNIERDADANAIKRAYFSAVKIHSPDKDPAGFKAIRLAYETLYDKKKREEYDSYFVLSGGLQTKLLAAREMIRENKYKQTLEFLTDLIHSNPDSADSSADSSADHQAMLVEAKRLLAEVLLYMKKTGTAKKICEELLEKNPSDADALLLQAQIAASMGHKGKVITYFENAVNVAPLNAKIWSAYIRYAMKRTPSVVSVIFQRAMKQDIDMFRDEYLLYLVGTRKRDLFPIENYLQYYDKFVEYFLLDKNHDEEMYETAMDHVARNVEKEEYAPFVKKILPALESSRHRKDGDEEEFDAFRTALTISALGADKRIHSVLTDMTSFFLSKSTNTNELLAMECFIVSELFDLRPSIKVLKNEYPDFFKLNRTFYLDVLNGKKEEQLHEKYTKVLKKIRASYKKNASNESDDDFSETDAGMPIIRSSPKVGRNEPCPCGSGEKYKKCCGR